MSWTSAQETEIATGDIPSVHIVVADDPEQRSLHGSQARVVHPVPKDSAHDREEIQVAVVDGCRPTGQAIARHEERPVETAAVVGDQPAIGRDEVRQGAEQGRLVGGIASPDAGVHAAGRQRGGGLMWRNI